MNYSQTKKAIKSGRAVFNQALAQYPAAVIQSIANGGLVDRILPSAYLRENTDRHERAAIREALGMLRDDTLVAYGAAMKALDKGDENKAIAIFHATGMLDNPHAFEAFDRYMARKKGRKSITQERIEKRKLEREYDLRQKQWLQNSLHHLNEYGTRWDAISRDIYERTHPNSVSE